MTKLLERPSIPLLAAGLIVQMVEHRVICTRILSDQSGDQITALLVEAGAGFAWEWAFPKQGAPPACEGAAEIHRFIDKRLGLGAIKFRQDIPVREVEVDG